MSKGMKKRKAAKVPGLDSEPAESQGKLPTESGRAEGAGWIFGLQKKETKMSAESVRKWQDASTCAVEEAGNVGY